MWEYLTNDWVIIVGVLDVYAMHWCTGTVVAMRKLDSLAIRVLLYLELFLSLVEVLCL